MSDWPIWVWILIVAIVVLAVLAIIFGSRRSDADPAPRNDAQPDPKPRSEGITAPPGGEGAGAQRAAAGVAEDTDTGNRQDLRADAVSGADAPGEPRSAQEPVDTNVPSAPPAPAAGDEWAQPVAQESVDTPEGLRADGAEQDRTGGAQAVRRDLPERDTTEDLRLDDRGPARASTDDAQASDDLRRDEQGRRLDPYGNPVDQADDVPRDEQGRRLDPYGNPVDQADDVPRDEQGRRLDPYGNPIDERP